MSPVTAGRRRAGWHNRHCLYEKRAYSCPRKDERKYLAVLDKEASAGPPPLAATEEWTLLWLSLLAPLVSAPSSVVSWLASLCSASLLLLLDPSSLSGLLLLLLPSSLFHKRFRFFVCLLFTRIKFFHKNHEIVRTLVLCRDGLQK